MGRLGLMNRVLLIARDTPSRGAMQQHLAQCGYEVLTSTSLVESLQVLARYRIGCALADVRDDDLQGPEAVRQLIKRESRLAVVALTAPGDLSTALEAMRCGALDCVTESDSLPEVEAVISRALDRSLEMTRQEAAARAIREEVGRLAAELRGARTRAEDLALAALESLVCVVEARDSWLAGHSIRVAQLAASLADEMQRTDQEIELVRLAGRLHDIGMIGLGDGILSKEGPLTSAEFDQVKRHVLVGSQILAPLPGLAVVGSFVRHHHERWDGEGYPDRVVGEAIPWGARLIGAAEIYDALTTVRPYREPVSPELAVEDMRRLSGTVISPQVFEALASVVGRHGALVFLDDNPASFKSITAAAVPELSGDPSQPRMKSDLPAHG
jgi:putative two-component system response regulator